MTDSSVWIGVALAVAALLVVAVGALLMAATGGWFFLRRRSTASVPPARASVPPVAAGEARAISAPPGPSVARAPLPPPAPSGVRSVVPVTAPLPAPPKGGPLLGFFDEPDAGEPVAKTELFQRGKSGAEWDAAAPEEGEATEIFSAHHVEAADEFLDEDTTKNKKRK